MGADDTQEGSQSAAAEEKASKQEKNYQAVSHQLLIAYGLWLKWITV
jgi:hypothetical protein